jgi:hypothetical protein
MLYVLYSICACLSHGCVGTLALMYHENDNNNSASPPTILFLEMQNDTSSVVNERQIEIIWGDDQLGSNHLPWEEHGAYPAK